MGGEGRGRRVREKRWNVEAMLISEAE